MEPAGRPFDKPVAVARLRLTKSGPARFMSHLDFIRAIERSARRAGLPMALSAGFHPHPRMSFSPALAVGISSECEFVDVELREKLAAGEVAERLEGCLPPGIGLVSCSVIDPGAPALSSVIRAASYRLEFRPEDVGAAGEVARAVDAVLKADAVPVTRTTPKGVRQVDLRPLVYDLRFERRGELPSLHMLVAAGAEGSARPLDVVQALAGYGALRDGARPIEIIREGLYVLRDGKFAFPR
ncbi:MAG: TIGR03936 family radical SAM-associated protein [Bacillota bacterium]